MKEKFESVKQENKRLLEIINAKPLETVDIDSAFEIEKLKEQLQAKEQECEELKKELTSFMNGDYCVSGCSLKQQLDKLKADNEQLKEELSVIQHNYNREGCKYYDDDTFKVFYECKAQKALQLSANSVTTKYCDLLKTLTEIKEICNSVENIENINSLYDAKLSGMFLQANKILQKISECEVENAR